MKGRQCVLKRQVWPAHFTKFLYAEARTDVGKREKISRFSVERKATYPGITSCRGETNLPISTNPHLNYPIEKDVINGGCSTPTNLLPGWVGADKLVVP